MKINNWNIGVCSWSLQQNIEYVADTMKDLGLTHIHLAAGPALGKDGEKYLEFVKNQNWTISSMMIDFPQEDYSTLETIRITGGIVPDEYWDTNKKLFLSAAEVTAKLKVAFLSTHIGFIDHTQPDQVKNLQDRVRFFGDVSAENNITLLLETGQETARDLKCFLEELDHPAIGVNFDPANMILYNKGEPIQALGVLGQQIKHVHIKDALRSETPGNWGLEVPWGTGQVNQERFLTALKDVGFKGTLAIEREAGDDRIGDIKRAVNELRKL